MNDCTYPRPPRAGLGLSTTTGASGERKIASGNSRRVPRPSGTALTHLLEVMANLGYPGIPPTGFDAVELPQEACEEGFSFSSPELVLKWSEHFIFVEIKTCTQERVDEGFGRFLFSFPEVEIRAAEILGERHIVLLYNQLTGQTLRTCIPELLGRASSKVWQLTVQLSPTEEVWDGPDVFDLFGGPPSPPDVFDLFRPRPEPLKEPEVDLMAFLDR